MSTWLILLSLAAAAASFAEPQPQSARPAEKRSRPPLLKEHFQVLQRDGANRASAAIVLPADVLSNAQLSILVESSAGSSKRPATRIESFDNPPAVLLENLAVGGPYRIGVHDGRRSATLLVEFHDVLVGDIWVLGGQSNMFGADIIKEPLPAIAGINMLDLRHFDRDAHWAAAIPPIHRIPEQFAPFTLKSQHPEYTDERIREIIAAKIAVGGIDSSYFFARKLYAETKVPIGLIPCATGGSLSIWNPAERAHNRYGFLLHHIESAGGRIKGMLFFQGEQDAIFGDERETVTKPSLISPVSTYGDRFVEFCEALRKDVDNPELPVLFAQICRHHNSPPGRDRFWEIVREQQRLIPERLAHSHCISAVDLDVMDGLHLDYESHRRHGERMARLALQYLQPGASATSEIRLKSVARGTSLKPTILVEFDGVTGKLRAPGRPTGFVLKREPSGEPLDWIYKVDFDPARPNVVVLHTTTAPTADTALYYGAGVAPYVNLTDEADMPVPAFGPVSVP